MHFGRYLEEFKVGDVYKHWPGRTITESDDILFCMLTMNHHPLHIDANYAAGTQFGRNVVVGNLVVDIALGMSVRRGERQGHRQPGLRQDRVPGPHLPRRHHLRRDHRP